MSNLALTQEFLETPLGIMHIITDEDETLRAAEWESDVERMTRLLNRHYGVGKFDLKDRQCKTPSKAFECLARYFDGDISALDELETATGGTDFQRTVWKALRTIPHGKTMSYTQLAYVIGNPKAARAVGLANGANPIAIVVPCHRVIGADGKLTGYAGGLEKKRWLLNHEIGKQAELSF